MITVNSTVACASAAAEEAASEAATEEATEEAASEAALEAVEEAEAPQPASRQTDSTALRVRAANLCRVFIIGTGVGGGIIANGQLVRGVHFTAGEYSFVNTNAEAWDAPDQNMACQCSTRKLLL